MKSNNKLSMEIKKNLITRAANLKASKVRNIKMDYKMETTANILQQRAIDSNIQVELTRISMKKSQVISHDFSSDEML